MIIQLSRPLNLNLDEAVCKSDQDNLGSKCLEPNPSSANYHCDLGQVVLPLCLSFLVCKMTIIYQPNWINMFMFEFISCYMCDLKQVTELLCASVFFFHLQSGNNNRTYLNGLCWD